MKRFFMSALAILFPAFVFLIYDNPGAALVALILQATIIGWIPATVWAFRTTRQHKKKASKKTVDL